MTAELVAHRARHRPRGPHDRARQPDGRSGDWETSVESINSLIDDLVRPTTEVARVIEAVAEGDLCQKMALDHRGPAGQGRVPPHRHDGEHDGRPALVFADEVTRVAREVGTEGKLGGQAEVPGVAGTWNDLTDSVNSMATNLTDQVRNIAQVTTAVANGDLTQKITVDAKGEMLELKNTINTMVDQLGRSPTRSRASRARSAPRASSAARPRCRGVVRHLARPDRERQLHGVEPDRPGARHRPGRDRRRQGRPDARRSPSTPRARSPRWPTRSTR